MTPETDFFPCTARNRNADVIVDWFRLSEQVQTGDMVTLVGSVHNNRYEKDGGLSSARLKRNSIVFDPQANLSEYLKYEPDGNPTMTQLIMSFLPISYHIKRHTAR